MNGMTDFTLSFIILSLVSAIFLTVYSWQFFESQKSKFKLFAFYQLCFVVFLYFMLSTNNWLVFLFWWEAITIITSLLINLSSSKTAWRYFWWQTAGASLLIAGLVFLSLEDQTYSIRELESSYFVLIIFGLGVKSAILGFHFWLPPTHAEVGSPSSAFLSGISIKLGIVPMLYLLPGGSYEPLVIVGIVLFIVGACSALVQRNVKRILAYSTLSNLGLIYFLLGSSAQEANYIAQLHIYTHVVGKTGLFLTAGLIGKACGSYKYQAWRRLDFTTKHGMILGALWTCGLLMLSGLPPTMFLTGKHYLEPLIASSRPISMFFWLGSLFTFAYLLRLLSILLPIKGIKCIPAKCKISSVGIVSTAMVFMIILIPLFKPGLLPIDVQQLIAAGEQLPFKWWKYSIDIAISFAVIFTAMSGMFYVTKYMYYKKLTTSIPEKISEMVKLANLYISFFISGICPFSSSMWMIVVGIFLIIARAFIPESP